MSRHYKIKLIMLGIALSLGSGICACGQKGDLYLPPEANHSPPDFSDTA